MAKYAQEASDVVHHIREALQDPRDIVEMTPTPRYGDLTSLGGGLSGISLLYSSGDVSSFGRAAERHFSFIARNLTKSNRYLYSGLFHEVCGFGFALEMFNQVTGKHNSPLAKIDIEVAHSVDAIIDAHSSRCMGLPWRYDVISGLSGLGRYLLLRKSDRTSLVRLLECLVDWSAPLRFHGETVSGLWSSCAPNPYHTSPYTTLKYGHLNTGLSHGVAGPLALLSLALMEGVEVAGHEAAIRRLVNVFERFRFSDRHGEYWPNAISINDWAGGGSTPSRPRPSWCYGAPGISRALQLAAMVLSEDDWLQLSYRSIRSVLDVPLDRWGIDNFALCHGWSGILHLLRFFRDGPDSALVVKVMDEIAYKIVTGTPKDILECTRVNGRDLLPEADIAGLLNGAAGIALALDAYATERVENLWDACLLVS
ncbi:lanthionine synthetase C family protein [Streptomyces sp. enrichment culture]|uniref:lanthionine synthetase C family protein n=1 Tax=Streptomyces sp. enrichment culture TaxID=1795815 RepID=UPI003F559E20